MLLPRGISKVITRGPLKALSIRGQRRVLSDQSFNHELSPSQFEYHKCPELNLKMKLSKKELLDGYEMLNVIRNLELTCDQVRPAFISATLVHRMFS